MHMTTPANTAAAEAGRVHERRRWEDCCTAIAVVLCSSCSFYESKDCVAPRLYFASAFCFLLLSSLLSFFLFQSRLPTRAPLTEEDHFPLRIRERVALSSVHSHTNTRTRAHVRALPVCDVWRHSSLPPSLLFPPGSVFGSSRFGDVIIVRSNSICPGLFSLFLLPACCVLAFFWEGLARFLQPPRKSPSRSFLQHHTQTERERLLSLSWLVLFSLLLEFQLHCPGGGGVVEVCGGCRPRTRQRFIHTHTHIYIYIKEEDTEKEEGGGL